MVKVLVEKEICGAPIKNHGTCDLEPHTSRGHSSPELRQFRRDAVAKHRAKNRKPKSPAPIDDSILDNEETTEEELCACDHTLDTCPNPKTCGLSRTQIEVRRKVDAEAIAREEERTRRLAQKETERQFITEALDKISSGEIPDHQEEKKLTEVIASYLGFSEDKRFRLTAQERQARGLDCELRLSEACFGPSYTGLYQSVDKLDESSFPVRLGKFLGVIDLHGSLNTPRHPDMKPKSPDVPLAPLGLPHVYRGLPL